MNDINSLNAEIAKLSASVDWWNAAIITMMFVAAAAATGLVATQYVAFSKAKRLSEAQASLTQAKDRQAEADSQDKNQKIAVAMEAAADSNRAAASSQLELARLVGPPYLVPVIHGVATPDLSKGNKQLVLLTVDTRIDLPTLPQGRSLTWTLILAQDAAGQHQFTFSPNISGFGNRLYSPAHSKWLVNMLSDSSGTVNVGLGGTFSPAPTAHP